MPNVHVGQGKPKRYFRGCFIWQKTEDVKLIRINESIYENQRNYRQDF